MVEVNLDQHQQAINKAVIIEWMNRLTEQEIEHLNQ